MIGTEKTHIGIGVKYRIILTAERGDGGKVCQGVIILENLGWGLKQ
jgi:hypothetical protein